MWTELNRRDIVFEFALLGGIFRGKFMRLCNCALAVGAVAALLSALGPANAAPTYITVDADSQPGTETHLAGVSDKGSAVGYFGSGPTGFIYRADGTIIVVNYAGLSALRGINKSGATTGALAQGNRSLGGAGKPNGSIKAFSVFNKKNLVDTAAINEAGEIIGTYYSGASATHGFVRDSGGNITSFDATEFGTYPRAINATGSITGYSHGHCFVRDPAGNLTTFDPTGQTNGTCQSINDNGTIVGTYTDNADNVHSFLRSARGTTTTFDAPGAGTSFGQGTFAVAINKKGVIVGYIYDSNFIAHGFVRSAAGNVTVFDMPVGDGVAQSTTPTSINTSGEIAGSYTDSSNLSHGFIRLP